MTKDTKETGLGMTRSPKLLFVPFVLFVSFVVPVLAQQPVPDAQAHVRAREVAFAQTMADRNLAAFESFLSQEAVFVGGGGALRGPAAIVGVWRKFYEGPRAPFSWQPGTVEVLQSGSLALSSGPVFDPDGTRIGTFNSVWRREPDGVWRIVFDNGCP